MLGVRNELQKRQGGVLFRLWCAAPEPSEEQLVQTWQRPGSLRVGRPGTGIDSGTGRADWYWTTTNVTADCSTRRVRWGARSCHGNTDWRSGSHGRFRNSFRCCRHRLQRHLCLCPHQHRAIAVEFPSSIQGTHLSEADTVPVEPVILSSAEVEEVDTADTDAVLKRKTQGHQPRPVRCAGLSEPEMLGVLMSPLLHAAAYQNRKRAIVSGW